MALDDVRRIRPAKDGDFTEDLTANLGVAIAVNDFESVDCGCAFVADFVHSSAVSVTENLKLFEFRDGDSSGRSSCGGGDGRREG